MGSGERDVSPGGGEDEVTDEGTVLVSHWEQHRFDAYTTSWTILVHVARELAGCLIVSCPDPTLSRGKVSGDF